MTEEDLIPSPATTNLMDILIDDEKLSYQDVLAKHVKARLTEDPVRRNPFEKILNYFKPKK